MSFSHVLRSSEMNGNAEHCRHVRDITRCLSIELSTWCIKGTHARRARQPFPLAPPRLSSVSSVPSRAYFFHLINLHVIFFGLQKMSTDCERRIRTRTVQWRLSRCAVLRYNDRQCTARNRRVHSPRGCIWKPGVLPTIA